MWNNLFDWWKGFSFLGALSLPLLGVFFAGTKVINWSDPSGYYTKLKLFITKKNESTSSSQSSGRVADLIAEYQTTSLDKKSYWKYCLPKNSKLSKKLVQTTSSTSTEECKLDWNKSSNSDLIGYLLDLGNKFLKLRHQMNLLMIYHFDKNVQEKNDDKDDIPSKCKLKNKSNYLKEFFVSTTPISPNCLLVPEEVEMNLTVSNGDTQQQASSEQQSEIKLEELKKGTVNGNIKYTLSNYWGKLQDFSQSTNGDSNKKSITIEVLSKVFDLELGSSSTSESENSKLSFDSLFKKYEEKELKACDFLKDSQTISGGGNQMCKSN